MQTHLSTAQSSTSVVINSVLKNTYILLSLTLLFSAGTAMLAMANNASLMNPILYLLGFFGLYFLTAKTRNSGWGIVSVFALTGFMGYYLGPILNFYIHSLQNGTQLVMLSLAGTGLTFLGLSAYTIITRKDFNFLHNFIFMGCWIALIAVIVSLFVKIPALYLIISGGFTILSSAIILFETSRIVRGGERNYIMATITLYISIYNLFISLLNIFTGMNRN